MHIAHKRGQTEVSGCVQCAHREPAAKFNLIDEAYIVADGHEVYTLRTEADGQDGRRDPAAARDRVGHGNPGTGLGAESAAVGLFAFGCPRVKQLRRPRTPFETLDNTPPRYKCAMPPNVTTEGLPSFLHIVHVRPGARSSPRQT